MTARSKNKISGFVPLGEKPARLEMHVSYSCTQKCLFCSEAGRLARFKDRHFSPAEAVSLLKEKRAQGFSHVTFTGGEPAMLPWLPQALAIAKKLGYTTYITSNGQLLCEPEKFAAVLESLDELCLSFHSANPAIQDMLAASPGSAQRLAQTLELVRLSRKDIFLLTNTVVTEHNIDGLPQIIRAAALTGKLRHCLFSYPAPEGRGQANFAGLSVSFKTLRAKLPELEREAKKAAVALRFFGVPACALGKYAALANDRYFSPRVTVERALRGGKPAWREITTLAPLRRRVYLSQCGGCAEAVRCGGIFSAYLEKFGDGEFVPLRRAVSKV